MKNKKLNKKLLISILLIALAMIVACGYYLIFGNSKKSSSSKNDDAPVTITRNPSVFHSLIKTSNPLSEYLGGKEICQMIISGNSQISGSLNLLDLKNASSLVNKTSLEFLLNHSAPSKEMSFNANVKYNGNSALNANAYANDTAFRFNVPAKSDTIYSVEFKNVDSILLPTKLLNSLTGDLAELTGYTDLVSAYIYAIRDKYPDEYKKIVAGISSKPADKDKFSNSGITYTISNESVETFVTCVLSLSIEDENFRKLFAPVLYTYVESHVADFITDDGISDSDEIANSILNYLKGIASTFASSYDGSLQFTVWLTPSGQLAGLQGDNKLHLNNEEMSIHTELQTEQGDYSFDHVSASLSIGYAKKTVVLEFSRNLTTDEKTKTSECTQHIAYSLNQEHTFSLEQKQTFHPSTGRYFNNTVIANEDDKTLICDINGTFDSIEKGKLFQFHLDSFSLKENTENLIACSGDIKVKAGTADITVLKGNTKELTYMTDEELKKLFGLGGHNE